MIVAGCRFPPPSTLMTATHIKGFANYFMFSSFFFSFFFEVENAVEPTRSDVDLIHLKLKKKFKRNKMLL